MDTARDVRTRGVIALLLGLLGLLSLAAALRWFGGMRHDPAASPPRTHAFLLANLIPSEITLCSPVPDAALLFRRCDEEVARCVSWCNNFDPASEVSRLNARAAREDVTVSPELATVLTCARQVGQLTDGAFDVSVLPLVRLWKAAARDQALPDPLRLAEALGSVGLDKVRLNPETRQVKFLAPGTQIDLGGISKGYIVDRLVTLLKAAGVKKGLVNIGGHVRVFGGTAEAPFHIGIQHPWRANDLAGSIAVTDEAVVTSGDYEQFTVIHGRHFSHILDPRTGQPVSSSPSVTVVAAEAMTADGLATGLSVLGMERGLAVVGKLPGVDGLFIHQGAQGMPEFAVSAGMVARFRPGTAAGGTPVRPLATRRTP